LATSRISPETTPGVRYSNPLYDQYYKFAVNSRTDHLYGLTLNLPLGDDLDVHSTAYYENKGGYGVSPESYATSLASHNAEAALYPELANPRGLQYGRSGISGIRKGITSSVDWRLGDIQTLSAGFWYEDDEYHRTQRRYNVADGNPDGAVLYDEVVHYQRDYTSTRRTRQFFLRDTLSLLEDRLRLDVGFKATDIDYAIFGLPQCRRLSQPAPAAHHRQLDRSFSAAGRAGVQPQRDRPAVCVLFGEHGTAARRR